MEAASEQILTLSRARRPCYVCFATAYMVVEATRNPLVRAAYAAAEIVSPDGVPLAWYLRSEGFKTAECVSGPRLSSRVLEMAARRNVRVGFYGGREETLRLIRSRLERELPDLKIAYMHSPPFRPLSEEEQRADIRNIVESGTEILFVGLGSPRQDLWMHQWSTSLACVSLGVGAAFEFYSGEKVLPPLWVQKLGLTWLVRLCQEPRRLIRRNLASPVFVYLVLKDRIRRMIGQGQDVSVQLPNSTSAVDLLSPGEMESTSYRVKTVEHREEAKSREICP